MQPDVETELPSGAEVPAAAGTGSGATAAAGAAGAGSGSSTDARARAQARRRARRAWRLFTAVLLAGLLVLVLSVGWIWAHGEVRHTHLTVSAVTPRNLPEASLHAALQPAWNTGDQLAAGDAVDEDVVVTYGPHAVSGRDAATGVVRWSYTRTDRRLCWAGVDDGTAAAVYEHDGICDEMTALNATNGVREWTRTLVGNGPMLSMQAGYGYFLFVHRDTINLVETGAIDNFVDQQPTGCTTTSAVLGTRGVLFSSRCADGDKLSLHESGEDAKNQRHQNRTWTVAADGATALSADTLITALGSDGRTIQTFSAAKGVVTHTIGLPRPLRPAAPAQAFVSSAGGTELADVAGGTVGLSSTGTLLWQSTSTLSPTDTAVWSAQTGAIDSVAPETGRLRRIASAAGLVAGARVLPLGAGVVAGSAVGVVVYR